MNTTVISPDLVLKGSVSFDVTDRSLIVDAESGSIPDVGVRLLRGVCGDGIRGHVIFAQITGRRHGRGFSLRLYRKDASWVADGDAVDPCQLFVRIARRSLRIVDGHGSEGEPACDVPLTPSRFTELVANAVSLNVRLPGTVIGLTHVLDRRLIEVGEDLSEQDLLGLPALRGAASLNNTAAAMSGLPGEQRRRLLHDLVRRSMDSTFRGRNRLWECLAGKEVVCQ